MDAQLSGKATPEQIAEWKAKYGEIFEVIVGGDKVAYFKKADRATVRAALSFFSKDKIRYNEIFVENCWIGGDEAVKTDDDYFYGLTDLIDQLMTIKESEVKKL